MDAGQIKTFRVSFLLILLPLFTYVIVALIVNLGHIDRNYNLFMKVNYVGFTYNFLFAILVMSFIVLLLTGFSIIRNIKRPNINYYIFVASYMLLMTFNMINLILLGVVYHKNKQAGVMDLNFSRYTQIDKIMIVYSIIIILYVVGIIFIVYAEKPQALEPDNKSSGDIEWDQ